MAVSQLILDNIAFTYPDSVHPVFTDLHAHFGPGWTGVAGANGSGKTTLLRIAAGELHPRHGTVSLSGEALLCQQRTDDPPPMLREFLDAFDADAYRLRGQLAIEPDWPGRWNTLSHGERKRAQIAVALWRDPDIFLVDEPTNHIDGDARNMLMSALGAFRGAGIIVTHDRALLDTLCQQCLFLDDTPVMRPGGYSQGMLELSREREAMLRERHHAKIEVHKLKRELDARRREASGADRKRSKKGLARKDRDARQKIDMARVSGKDGAAGDRLRQLAGRFGQAEERLRGTKTGKEHALGIWMPGARARRDLLFSLPESRVALGAGRTLHIPPLSMRPDDRIGLTGANGTGKSTLIRHIAENLSLPPDRVIHIPQEISAGESRALLQTVRTLSHAELGHIMEIVSHLNSKPERLLDTGTPSPGEVRKLMLALGIMREPHLIIMDEPTNHLDLPSIVCLEQALTACLCGLLLVSHDLRFLANTTAAKWHIRAAGDGAELVTMTAQYGPES